MSHLAAAIVAIRSVENMTCSNQVDVFPDYDLVQADPTTVCRRLGIPRTNDPFLDYPAKRTFLPLRMPEILAGEERLNAELPRDYKRLLELFGEFHLPGEHCFCLEGPIRATSNTCDAWWFDDPAKIPVLSISPYHVDCDGDSIGFRRVGGSFSPQLYHFKQQLRHARRGSGLDHWTVPIAESLSDFIVQHVDQLKAHAEG